MEYIQKIVLKKPHAQRSHNVGPETVQRWRMKPKGGHDDSCTELDLFKYW